MAFPRATPMAEMKDMIPHWEFILLKYNYLQSNIFTMYTTIYIFILYPILVLQIYFQTSSSTK